MAINPRGQVPSFKDGDAVVNESVAAVLYLESQYSEPQLLPSEPAVKAKVRLWRSREILNVMSRCCSVSWRLKS